MVPVLGAFALGMLLCLVAAPPTINPYDEGLVAYGAQRVLAGEVPYRDFWTMYGPGAFYAGAGLYRLFGADLLAIRLMGFAAKTLVAIAAAVLAGRFSTPRRAALLGGGVLAMEIAVGQPAFPVFPALALILWGFVLVTSARPGRLAWPGAGVLFGLAALFRHDLGAYAVVAVALALAGAEGLAPPGRRNGRAALARIAALVAGALVVVVPVAGALIAVAGWDRMFFNLIYVPAAIYPQVRALPLGGISLPLSRIRAADLENLPTLAPFIAAAATALAIAARARGERGADRRGDFALPLLLLIATLVFSLKGIVRSTNLHMIQASVLAALSLLWALEAGPAATRLRKGLGVVAGVLLLAVAAAGVAECVGGIARLGGPDGTIALCGAKAVPGARCAMIDPDEAGVLAFIAAHSAPDDPLYIGPGRHDRIFANDLSLYFLAGRPSVTYWHDAHPGIQTAAPIQRQIVAALDRHCAALVVLDDQWNAEPELDRQRIGPGALVLDRHIAAHYSLAARFGRFRVLARPCPGGRAV